MTGAPHREHHRSWIAAIIVLVVLIVIVTSAAVAIRIYQTSQPVASPTVPPPADGPTATPSPLPTLSLDDALNLANATKLVDEQLSTVRTLQASAVENSGDGANATTRADAAIWAGILAVRIGDDMPGALADDRGTCPAPTGVDGAFVLNPVSRYVLPKELMDKAEDVPAFTIKNYRLGSVDGVWMQAYASTDTAEPLLTFRATACWTGTTGVMQTVARQIEVADGRDGLTTAQLIDEEKIPISTKGALLNLTFDKTKNGVYTRTTAEKEWLNKNGGLRSYSVSPPDSLTREGEDGDGYLVKSFPAGTYNNTSDDAIDHKMTIHWQMDAPLQSAYLSYRVKASDNFASVRGGKLPGLCGGTCPTGGQAATDASQIDLKNNPDGVATGWSGRNMWRPGGKLVQYIYYPDQTTEYAPDFLYGLEKQDVYVNDGAWHTIEHYVKMNTPGEHDGIFKAWYDGRLVLDLENIRYRDNYDYAVDLVKFTTYFGGHDASWAPTEDVSLAFDDLVVSEMPISH